MPPPSIELRDTVTTDLPLFYEQHRDPLALEMAQHNPRSWTAFMQRWGEILSDDAIHKQTVLCGGEIAGHLLCFEQNGRRLVGYWLGREFWGQGVATAALIAFLDMVEHRPLHAFVARENVPSRRVLEKAGFRFHADDDTSGEVILALR